MVNFVCEGNKEKEGLGVSVDSQALLRIHSPTIHPTSNKNKYDLFSKKEKRRNQKPKGQTPN